MADNDLVKINFTADVEKAGAIRTLLASVKTRKVRYFGHVMRYSCPEKDSIQEVYREAGRQARPKSTWLNITEWTAMSLRRTSRTTDDRRRREIHDVINPQIEDD